MLHWLAYLLGCVMVVPGQYRGALLRQLRGPTRVAAAACTGTGAAGRMGVCGCVRVQVWWHVRVQAGWLTGRCVCARTHAGVCALERLGSIARNHRTDLAAVLPRGPRCCSTYRCQR